MQRKIGGAGTLHTYIFPQEIRAAAAFPGSPADFLEPFRTRVSYEHPEAKNIVIDLAMEPAETELDSAWGLSTTINAHRCDPATIRSREAIVRFTHELCDLLGVKRYGETQVVRFGADPRVYGFSMVQLIETSLVSAHFAEESDAVYLDIFSCKWYDAAAAARFAEEFFGAGQVDFETCLRR